MILAIPQEKKFFLEANILERTRNYSEIYFCDADFTGNYAFTQLLLELRKHPEEVPDSIPEATKKLDSIVERLIKTRNMTYVTNTIPVEELIK